MKEITFTFWFIDRDGEGYINRAAIRFYKDGERFIHLSFLKVIVDGSGKVCALLTIDDFGRIKTDEELRAFVQSKL